METSSQDNHHRYSPSFFLSALPPSADPGNTPLIKSLDFSHGHDHDDGPVDLGQTPDDPRIPPPFPYPAVLPKQEYSGPRQPCFSPPVWDPSLSSLVPLVDVSALGLGYANVEYPGTAVPTTIGTPATEGTAEDEDKDGMAGDMEFSEDDDDDDDENDDDDDDDDDDDVVVVKANNNEMTPKARQDRSSTRKGRPSNVSSTLVFKSSHEPSLHHHHPQRENELGHGAAGRPRQPPPSITELRKRNRVAAEGYRSRKRLTDTQLKSHSDELERECKRLCETHSNLTEELCALKCMLLEHAGCNCQLIQQYLRSTAAEWVGTKEMMPDTCWEPGRSHREQEQGRGPFLYQHPTAM